MRYLVHLACSTHTLFHPQFKHVYNVRTIAISSVVRSTDLYMTSCLHKLTKTDPLKSVVHPDH